MDNKTEKTIIEYLKLYKNGEIEEVFILEQINTLMQQAINTDIIPPVSQQSELLLSAICQFTNRNTQKEIQEVEKWIETDYRK